MQVLFLLSQFIPWTPLFRGKHLLVYIYPSRFFLHVNRFSYTGFLCFLDYYYFFFFLTHGFILPVLLWRLPFSRNITCHGQSLLSVCTDRSYNGGIVAMRCALLMFPLFLDLEITSSLPGRLNFAEHFMCASRRICAGLGLEWRGNGLPG